MFSCVVMKEEFLARVDFPFLNYVIKIKLMIQIQGLSKLLTYQIDKNTIYH